MPVKLSFCEKRKRFEKYMKNIEVAYYFCTHYFTFTIASTRKYTPKQWAALLISNINRNCVAHKLMFATYISFSVIYLSTLHSNIKGHCQNCWYLLVFVLTNEFILTPPLLLLNPHAMSLIQNPNWSLQAGLGWCSCALQLYKTRCGSSLSLEYLPTGHAEFAVIDLMSNKIFLWLLFGYNHKIITNPGTSFIYCISSI